MGHEEWRNDTRGDYSYQTGDIQNLRSEKGELQQIMLNALGPCYVDCGSFTKCAVGEFFRCGQSLLWHHKILDDDERSLKKEALREIQRLK
ncbi:hypothetical protein C5167_050130 [Papaver somniferum]|uniref:Uncharacterized protein n=1 Tax=Papaver somniferum TaxID=3469 RepID=A0A4Y7KP62_PAPSO|nr:hypothetical protein C5167_050130 [Papaver somniferum]